MIDEVLDGLVKSVNNQVNHISNYVNKLFKSGDRKWYSENGISKYSDE